MVNSSSSCVKCRYAGVIDDGKQSCLLNCPQGYELKNRTSKICEGIELFLILLNNFVFFNLNQTCF